MHNEHCYFDMGITPPFRNWWNWCEPLPTDDQKADLFTKLLDSKRFEFLCQNIGVILKEWSLLFLLLSHAFASSIMLFVWLFGCFFVFILFFYFSFHKNLKKLKNTKNSVCLCILVLMHLGWPLKQSFLNFVSLIA